MGRECRPNFRVLKYVKHLVLAVRKPGINTKSNKSSLAFRYVRPEYMPLLNEVSIDIHCDHKHYRMLFKGLAQYAHSVKLNLYITLHCCEWISMPMFENIDTCKALNIQSLTLLACSEWFSPGLIKSISDFKSLRKLCLISRCERPERARARVGAMSLFFNKLEKLEHLTLDIPREGFVWNLPPKVWYLNAHIGLFHELPEDMFSSVKVLELPPWDRFSPYSGRNPLVLDPPFTSLVSLGVHDTSRYNNKAFELLIRRFVASNPGLTNLAPESINLPSMDSSTARRAR